MLAREVVRDAKNLIQWDRAREVLSDALDYAMSHRDELESDGYLETDNGTSAHLDYDGNLIASLFVGTVFSLTPSGKYYMPFACSNVELCPRCKGTGQTKNGKHCAWCDGLGSREAYLDQVWCETVESEGDKRGICLESGEGDPCDLFLTMAVYLD